MRKDKSPSLRLSLTFMRRERPMCRSETQYTRLQNAGDHRSPLREVIHIGCFIFKLRTCRDRPPGRSAMYQIRMIYRGTMCHRPLRLDLKICVGTPVLGCPKFILRNCDIRAAGCRPYERIDGLYHSRSLPCVTPQGGFS